MAYFLFCESSVFFLYIVECFYLFIYFAGLFVWFINHGKSNIQYYLEYHMKKKKVVFKMLGILICFHILVEFLIE